ncbi:hypothetical protein MMIC_P1992 [Mariprofundus micogutta]|uniref:EF-hand domain-containing protein n=1 Tax=Mariprofundus micogutta TaxID=1921010 RepID=A0A1L8CQ52_9PROT|nr:hypothetical protein [Mariprofundus micogutta]GAV21013.1 hypothetical protein MMIC_P1992 [Mariprofundus micogutta]
MFTIECPKSIKTLCSALLLAALLAATPAIAKDSSSDDFDANGDGKVTFEEVMKRLEPSVRAAFDSMDHNKDGVLSDKDFDDMRKGMKELQQWLDDLLDPFLPEEKPERVEV